MDFKTYMNCALETCNPLTHKDRLDMCILGLYGESGEVADLIKKSSFHGHELDNDKLIKELGDVCWYVAVSLDTVGHTLSGPITPLVFFGNVEAATFLSYHVGRYVNCLCTDNFPVGTAKTVLETIAWFADLNTILETNVAKLRKRYPDGFSFERSINRAE
jgi:hypothetical protein